MRKALIIFILIFAIALSGGVYAFHDASQPRDEVIVSEHLRYGDAAAAEGLSLEMHTTYDYHLFWDIAYTAAQPENTQTAFRASAKRDYGDLDYAPMGLTLMEELDAWRYDDFTDVDPAELSGLTLAYRELWQEVPAGEERAKEITLKDYIDYYPMGGEVDLPGGNVLFFQEEIYDENSVNAYAAFNEYFKIPVLENETRYISLGKDANGNICSRGGGTGNSDHYNIWTRCVTLPDAVYFTLNNRSNQGELIDMSLVPGGFGIYRLPYTVTDGVNEVDFENLSTAKSLDEEFDITFMLADEPQEKIILIGKLGGEIRMLVIDAGSMETLQDILIADDSESCWLYHDGGDFLTLALDNNRLALVERQENGEYLLRFVIDDPAHGEWYYRHDQLAWAWNGEKLAMSGFRAFDDINNRYVADFFYAVYDETGLLCFVDCDSSLSPNSPIQWHGVRGIDDGAMELTWF